MVGPLQVYRKTLKRVGVIHRLGHGTTDLLLRSYSACGGFHTMPDDPMWFRLQLLTGGYEKGTVTLVRREITRGMTVLDVGAHVGYYTRLFSRLVGDEGRVISFEPNPRTFQALFHNVRHSKNVTAVEAAVSSLEGVGQLHDGYIDTGGASLKFDSDRASVVRRALEGQERLPRMDQIAHYRRYTVKTVSLDGWLGSVGLRSVDFLKMDIEGAELLALGGMERTVTSSPNLKMVMEFSPRALQSFDVSAKDMWEALLRYGFRISVICEAGELRDISGLRAMEQLAAALESPTAPRVNLFCERANGR